MFFKKNSFLIGREKPGAQSEVARLISETLEQEKNQLEQQQHLDDDPYEHSTEEVSSLDGCCSGECNVHVTCNGSFPMFTCCECSLHQGCYMITELVMSIEIMYIDKITHLLMGDV